MHPGNTSQPGELGNDMLVDVICPEGVQESELLAVQLGSGERFEVLVPNGVRAGETFQVEIDEKQAAMQSNATCVCRSHVPLACAIRQRGNQTPLAARMCRSRVPLACEACVPISQKDLLEESWKCEEAVLAYVGCG